MMKSQWGYFSSPFGVAPTWGFSSGPSDRLKAGCLEFRAFLTWEPLAIPALLEPLLGPL